MTTRSLWDDTRRTAQETTRELFAPLTFVVRAITSTAKPASSVSRPSKMKWYAEPVKGHASEEQVTPKVAKALMAQRMRRKP